MLWWFLIDIVVDKSFVELFDCLLRFEVCVLYLFVRFMVFDEVLMYLNLINEVV